MKNGGNEEKEDQNFKNNSVESSTELEVLNESWQRKIHFALILLWWKIKRCLNRLPNVDSLITVAVATPGRNSNPIQVITYTDTKVIGKGVFGVVYQARHCETGEIVAIKQIYYNKQYKFREIQILRKLDHCNIIQLKYYFKTTDNKKAEVHINLVLEFLPQNLSSIIKFHNKVKKKVASDFIKLYMYQMFRALAYLHFLGICHRDIKPQNLLVDPERGILKLADLGSAKYLIQGTSHVSYICSRPYRAPELILGNNHYTTKIDVWSGGCVLGELFSGRAIFQGASGIEQLVEIIRTLGAPSEQQLKEMTPNYLKFRFLQKLPAKSDDNMKQLFNMFPYHSTQEAVDLLDHLLQYAPFERLGPLQACAHPFFDELRVFGARLPNGKDLPPLFNFTEQELCIEPSLNEILIPRKKDND